MVQPHKCSMVYVLELVGRGCVGRPGQYRAAVTNHCMSLSPPPRTPFPLAQPLLHLFIFFRFLFSPLPEPSCPLVQLHIPSKIFSQNFFPLPAHIYIFSRSSNLLIQLSSKHMQSAYILCAPEIADTKQISRQKCRSFQEQFGKINFLKDFHSATLRFVKKFTRPDFRTKNFTH